MAFRQRRPGLAVPPVDASVGDCIGIACAAGAAGAAGAAYTGAATGAA